MEAILTHTALPDLGDNLKETTFDELYFSLRKKEQRIYSDDEVLMLPNISRTHSHYKEWSIRRQSSHRLMNYLKSKGNSLLILEVGCGNGWLAAQLANLENAQVFAIDTNKEEIAQAKRVFLNPNLQFIHANFTTAMFNDLKFDIVLFAASIQYFSSLPTLIAQIQPCLKKNGEIHITDTNFYAVEDIDHAVERMEVYLQKLGASALGRYYHHHKLNDLAGYSYKILYHPKKILNRIFVKNPFYWISIPSQS
jgi:ubiquinone/menaquinone biosynthesis C-methylase UbiE